MFKCRQNEVGSHLFIRLVAVNLIKIKGILMFILILLCYLLLVLFIYEALVQLCNYHFAWTETTSFSSLLATLALVLLLDTFCES